MIHHFGKTWWAPTAVKDFSSFVERGERVLDIGAGGGWIGELLSTERRAEVTLLDVADFNRSKLPLVIYDGKRIPLPDNSFDTSLLLFVLHHCEDPLLVLKEALRVASKRIIIYEDTYTSSFGKLLTGINDFISNSPFFLSNPFKMNMPYNYKKVVDWERVFQELALKVKFKKTTQHLMTQHALFVLEK
ncbi:MAG: class I SAM-dependent methyltransferase [bacterium]|nr:class I SAM-dependent methyltransferase [bacterium]